MSEGKNAVTIALNPVKKITMKDCNAVPDLEKLIAHKQEHGDKAVLPLLLIVGSTSDYRSGETEKGQFIRFIGIFKAIHAETKTEYVSGQCILPGAAPDLVYGALQALGESGGSVDFMFKIGAKYDPTSITKYVYVIEQIIAANQVDPLQRLLDMAQGNENLLAAPVPNADQKPAETADEKPARKK